MMMAINVVGDDEVGAVEFNGGDLLVGALLNNLTTFYHFFKLDFYQSGK